VYRVAQPYGVTIVETGEWIVPGSLAWSNYLAWLAAGNAPLPAIVPDPAPPSQAEVDAEAELQTRTDIRASLLTDPAVVALMTWTPAQANAWIDANVVDLASARTALKLLARVLALIARELL
jgi:hypothetical protein